MNWVLKLFGFKNHDSSINRSLIRHEKKHRHNYTDSIYYWWFFHT